MRIAYLGTKRYLAGLLVIGSLLGGLGTSQADIVQPNGSVIPVGGALQNYLNGSADNDGINEGIDGIKDAAIEPQVFSPLCDFSGKYVAKGGGANFAIGWYKGIPSRTLSPLFRTDQLPRRPSRLSPPDQNNVRRGSAPRRCLVLYWL